MALLLVLITYLKRINQNKSYSGKNNEDIKRLGRREEFLKIQGTFYLTKGKFTCF